MKIYAYENPFKLTNASFWTEISSYPHLCVSQTLVQGLTRLYSRQSFGMIYTIDAFLEHYYTTWHNNTENEIKRYITLSDQISNLTNLEQQRAYKFNQRPLMDAVKFFMELGLNPEAFDSTELSEEQKAFLAMIRKLSANEVWGNSIKELDYQDHDDLKLALFKLLQEEYEKKLKMDTPADPESDSKKDLMYLNEMVEHYSTDSSGIEIPAVVFHGVHRFTPLILKFIHQLESIGVEVIFLINYSDRYPRIYETWGNVYEWTNLPILHDQGERRNAFPKNEIGVSIGGLLEGEYPENPIKKNVKALKFENLTTFTDYVKEIFIGAKTKPDGTQAKGNEALSRMKEQFYATENSRLSEMLKAYFPDQFGEKHFLSYPIGQFILSLYKMWDEREHTLKINQSLMKECLAVNFFHKPGMHNPVDIYNRLSLYVKDVETISSLLERLHKLADQVRELQIRSDHPDPELRGFSFYRISRLELAYFTQVIHDISVITRELFDSHVNGKLSYQAHFQKLIEILHERVYSGSTTDEKEIEMVEEIKKKFENIHDLQIDGSIDDLKESIHFYLNRSKYRVSQEESASWIVRNFEQLDGGVLLSKTQRGETHTYHLAMVSDRKMKVKLNDLLPWPMNDRFFQAYTNHLGSDLGIVLRSLKEYPGFLRYSFFYATYYLKNKITISYVEEMDGEKENAYFMLRLLGIECEPVDDVFRGEINVGYDQQKRVQPDIQLEELTLAQAQTFALCSYRYVLDHVVDDGGAYQSDYHCRLYFRSMMLYKCMPLVQESNEEVIRVVVKGQLLHYKDYFPFWRDIDFLDMESGIVKDIMKHPDPFYLKLRLNFLVAEVKENGKGLNLVNNALFGIRNKYDVERITPRIQSYYLNDKLLFEKEEVHPEICSICKNREICLHHFTVDRGDEDNE